MRPAVLIPACLMAAGVCGGPLAAEPPQAITMREISGTVVDEHQRPIRNVELHFSVPFYLLVDPPAGTSVAKPPGDTLHGLDRHVYTDAQGRFRLSYQHAEGDENRISFRFFHPDYKPVGRYWFDPRIACHAYDAKVHKTIPLRQLEVPKTVRRILAEQDTDKAKRRLVQLLRCASIDDLQRHYFHIGTLRGMLLELAEDQRTAADPTNPRDTVGYRARTLLAYWADPRDQAIVRHWWREERSVRQAFYEKRGLRIRLDKDRWSNKREYLPAVEPNADLDLLLSDWQTYMGVTGRVGAHGTETIHHAVDMVHERGCVRYRLWLRSHVEHYDLVLLKLRGRWRVLWHRPIRTDPWPPAMIHFGSTRRGLNRQPILHASRPLQHGWRMFRDDQLNQKNTSVVCSVGEGVWPACLASIRICSPAPW